MSELGQKRKFLVCERIGLKNVGEVYDVVDPADKRILGCAREEISWGGVVARWFLDRSFLHMQVRIETADQQTIATIDSPPGLIGRRYFLRAPSGAVQAIFRSKIHCCSCEIEVVTEDLKPLGRLLGDFRATSFTFTSAEGRAIGEICRHAGGLLKEMFTSADTYHVRLLGDQEQAGLILAATVIVDLMYHED